MNSYRHIMNEIKNNNINACVLIHDNMTFSPSTGALVTISPETSSGRLNELSCNETKLSRKSPRCSFMLRFMSRVTMTVTYQAKDGRPCRDALHRAPIKQSLVWTRRLTTVQFADLCKQLKRIIVKSNASDVNAASCGCWIQRLLNSSHLCLCVIWVRTCL